MTNGFVTLGMGAVLASALPEGADGNLWAQWGLAGIVVGFTLYRDMKREQRMASALDENQKFIQNALLSALQGKVKE